MSAITAKASRKMKKYAVLTREPRCFLGSFDFSWEQRKVQDVADRFDNLRIPVAANLRVHGTTPYYGANGIQDYVEGFTHDGEFVLVAEDGANDLKNYPVKCVNGRIWVNNHAHVLQGKAGISDNSFLAFAISQSDIESLLVGGSRAKLNAETLMSIEFKLPCLQEQYRIGEYLTQLDHLITLHQRECISFTARAGRRILTANKKRNTSSWEQRKVQDVADRFDNLRIPVAANLRVHGTTPYYGANGIQDYVEGFTHDGEFVLVAEDGANDLKNYPVKCVNGRIWVNNHAHVLQGKAGISDNSFLAFAISQSDIESLLVGGSRAKLNAETLMSIEFKLPCLQEQYRIGEYLTQLDHLITLHQRKPFLMKWRTSDANRNQTNRLVL